MLDILKFGIAQAAPAAPAVPAAAGSGSSPLQIGFLILMVLGVILGVGLSVLIFFTGKGDAMGGGSSSVRTNFKGKTNFDDQMHKVTMIMGLSFMAIMVICDLLLHQIEK